MPQFGIYSEKCKTLCFIVHVTHMPIQVRYPFFGCWVSQRRGHTNANGAQRRGLSILIGPRIGIVKGTADYETLIQSFEWTAGQYVEPLTCGS